MKDAPPRIFRSLEQARGDLSFDTIVSAAVAAYASLRSPSEAQARDFGRLVSPLFERTGPETRRSLSAALSHVPRVPRELVELLLASPAEISAPFLVSTPTLTARDHARLQASGDERIQRIVAGRVERGLGALPDAAAPVRAERLRVNAPPLSPEAVATVADAASPGAADFVRETLRRLVRVGRPGSGHASFAEDPAPMLLEAVRQGDQIRFFRELDHRLALTENERESLEADRSGHALARLLRDLDLGAGDALAILMLARPAVGLDVAAFEAMNRHYRSLERRPRSTPRPSAVLLRRAAGRRASEAGGEDGESRPPVFGRREVRPETKRGSER